MSFHMVFHYEYSFMVKGVKKETRPLKILTKADFFNGDVTIFNIWTIGPVDIGIGGKMFLKKVPLEKLSENFIKFFFRIEILLHLGVPYNQFLLHFGVPDNQILLRFGVPDNLILLHFCIPDNCSSGPSMARRIYSLSSCQGHWNGVKFGCRGHWNGVKFGCWGHWYGVKFSCRGHPNGVKF